MRDHREQIGLDVEAAAGDTSKIDLIWVPGEGSSTGNVTGGRKFARHHFFARYLSRVVAMRAKGGEEAGRTEVAAERRQCPLKGHNRVPKVAGAF